MLFFRASQELLNETQRTVVNESKRYIQHMDFTYNQRTIYEKFIIQCISGSEDQLKTLWNKIPDACREAGSLLRENELKRKIISSYVNVINQRPLHLAAINNQLHMLEHLCKEIGSDKLIDARDTLKLTALYYCCMGKIDANSEIQGMDGRDIKFKCLKLLLEKGAEPRIMNSFRQTPLHWTAKNRYESMTSLILNHLNTHQCQTQVNMNRSSSQTSVAPIQNDLLPQQMFGIEKDNNGFYPFDIAGSQNDIQSVLVYVDFAMQRIEEHLHREENMLNNFSYSKYEQNMSGLYYVKDEKRKTIQKKIKKDVKKQLKKPEQIIELDMDWYEDDEQNPNFVKLGIFYWAAYFGQYEIIRDYMLIKLRWSPFVPTFQGKSVLTGAILGQQMSIVSLITSFQYKNIDKHKNWSFVRNVWQLDQEKMNSLHHAYAIDQPDVRQILRESTLSQEYFYSTNELYAYLMVYYCNIETCPQQIDDMRGQFIGQTVDLTQKNGIPKNPAITSVEAIKEIGKQYFIQARTVDSEVYPCVGDINGKKARQYLHQEREVYSDEESDDEDIESRNEFLDMMRLKKRAYGTQNVIGNQQNRKEMVRLIVFPDNAQELWKTVLSQQYASLIDTFRLNNKKTTNQDELMRKNTDDSEENMHAFSAEDIFTKFLQDNKQHQKLIDQIFADKNFRKNCCLYKKSRKNEEENEKHDDTKEKTCCEKIMYYINCCPTSERVKERRKFEKELRKKFKEELVGVLRQEAIDIEEKTCCEKIMYYIKCCPARKSKEKKTGSKEKKTESKEKKTESKEKKTESKEKKTESKEKKTESKEKKTESKEKKTESDKESESVKRFIENMNEIHMFEEEERIQQQGEQFKKHNRLENAKNLTTRQKLAYVENPDWCLLLKSREKERVVLRALEPLFENNSIYFSSFEVYQTGEILLVLYFDDDYMDVMAELNKLQVKHKDCLVEYKAFASTKFEPFDVATKHAIIQISLQSCFDINQMKKDEIVLDSFPLFNRTQYERICRKHGEGALQLWRKFALSLDPKLMNQKSQFLNLFAAFYGTEYAFSWMFLISYYSWLFFPMIVGFIFFIINIFFNLRNNQIRFDECLEEAAGPCEKDDFNFWLSQSSSNNGIYASLMVFTGFMLIRRWGLIRTVLTADWVCDMRNRKISERPNFIHKTIIQKETQDIEKRDITPKYVSWFFVFGFNLIFCSVIVLLNIVIREFQLFIYSLWLDEEDSFWKTMVAYFPSFLSTLLIYVAQYLNKYAAEYLTGWQNFQFDQQHQDSYITKLYVLNFIIAYFNLFYLGYYTNSFQLIASNYLSIVLIGLLSNNFVDLAFGLVTVAPAITKIEEDKRYKRQEKIAEQAMNLIVYCSRRIKYFTRKLAEEGKVSLKELQDKANQRISEEKKAKKKQKELYEKSVKEKKHSNDSDSDSSSDQDSDTVQTSTKPEQLLYQLTENMNTKLSSKCREVKRIKDLRAQLKQLREISLRANLELLEKQVQLEQTKFPNDNKMIDYFIKTFINMGYIVFFGAISPIAPALAAYNAVYLEIKIRFFVLFNFYRKPVARHSDGIGVWETILHFIIMMAILANLVILIGLGQDDVELQTNIYLGVEGVDEIERTNSRTVDFLYSINEERWDEASVVTLLFVFEHFLLACFGVFIFYFHNYSNSLKEANRKVTMRKRFSKLAQQDIMSYKRQRPNEFMTIQERFNYLWQIVNYFIAEKVKEQRIQLEKEEQNNEFQIGFTLTYNRNIIPSDPAEIFQLQRLAINSQMILNKYLRNIKGWLVRWHKYNSNIHPSMILQTLSKLDGKDIITKYEILNNIKEKYKFGKKLKRKAQGGNILELQDTPQCEDDLPLDPTSDDLSSLMKSLPNKPKQTFICDLSECKDQEDEYDSSDEDSETIDFEGLPSKSDIELCQSQTHELLIGQNSAAINCGFALQQTTIKKRKYENFDCNLVMDETLGTRGGAHKTQRKKHGGSGKYLKQIDCNSSDSSDLNR